MYLLLVFRQFLVRQTGCTLVSNCACAISFFFSLSGATALEGTSDQHEYSTFAAVYVMFIKNLAYSTDKPPQFAGMYAL